MTEQLKLGLSLLQLLNMSYRGYSYKEQSFHAFSFFPLVVFFILVLL